MHKRQLNASALMPVVRKSLWLFLWLLGTSAITPAFASKDTSFSPIALVAQKMQQDLLLAEQRKRYQQAEQAYKKGHYRKFKQLSASLGNYPLHPYLEYKDLTRRPSSLSRRQINAFLQANDDTIIGDRFRLKMVKHAAKTKNWQALLDIYRPGYGVSTECLYLNALIKTGQERLAYSSIKNLWLSEHTQPKNCNPVFKHWKKAGYMTQDLVWQRFKMAMSASNRKLARYLLRYMHARDAAVAKSWLRVHKKPEVITSKAILGLQHAEKTNIILHGIKRLSYRDIDAAINTYHELSSYPFTPQQHAEINRLIGLKLARRHMPDANIWLDRVPQSHANTAVKEWRIRTAIRQGDWTYVLKSIANLTIDEQAKHRWQYWWAYANEQLGNTNDAMGIYQYLATKRSYYGFLAADNLNLSYAFEDKPVEPSYELMKHVKQLPEVVRAKEFYLMGQLIPARREWHRLLYQTNYEEKLAASKIAQSWDWHDRAIITMGKTHYRDDIELRFPLHFDQKVHNWSNKRKIEPAWTYAIIRRESAFVQDARSSVGAMGLMQLMPNTARHVARQLNIRYKGRQSLLASNTNIRLGTGYLMSMLNKLDSQHVLATAAYNAGPHRVEKWLPETHKMEAIRWIETIPFTETREYVSNVLAYMVIYEHRMNRKITRLSQRMPQVPAKNPHIASTADSSPLKKPLPDT